MGMEKHAFVYPVDETVNSDDMNSYNSFPGTLGNIRQSFNIQCLWPRDSTSSFLAYRNTFSNA